MLTKHFSNVCLCAKVVAKHDCAGDPRCIWRTLAYKLASLHAGLKGSIMETLSDSDSHYSQITSVEDQFQDLVVKVMWDQQFLSIVIVIEALDECLTEDYDHWRALLSDSCGLRRFCPRCSGLWSLVGTSRHSQHLGGSQPSHKPTTGNKVLKQ